MEVHPPEHGIHSLRDFLVHMGTITLGLLIALGLEALVEQAHHRHLLHTAEANLRDELRSNRALLSGDERSLNDTQRQLEQSLAAMQAALAHRPGPPDTSGQWRWSSPQSAAWDTARDEGAIGLMSYESASQYADVYSQQKLVNEQAVLYVRDLYSIAPTWTGGTKLADEPPAQLNGEIEGVTRALADLKLLRDYCSSLDRIYDKATDL
jgi:hypothetical protein